MKNGNINENNIQKYWKIACKIFLKKQIMLQICWKQKKLISGKAWTRWYFKSIIYLFQTIVLFAAI